MKGQLLGVDSPPSRGGLGAREPVSWFREAQRNATWQLPIGCSKRAINRKEGGTNCLPCEVTFKHGKPLSQKHA